MPVCSKGPRRPCTVHSVCQYERHNSGPESQCIHPISLASGKRLTARRAGRARVANGQALKPILSVLSDDRQCFIRTFFSFHRAQFRIGTCDRLFIGSSPTRIPGEHSNPTSSARAPRIWHSCENWVESPASTTVRRVRMRQRTQGHLKPHSSAILGYTK
jgi:hypothetical protein